MGALDDWLAEESGDSLTQSRRIQMHAQACHRVGITHLEKAINELRSAADMFRNSDPEIERMARHAKLNLIDMKVFATETTPEVNW